MIERYSDHRRMSGRFSPGCAPRSPSWRSVFWSRSSTCSCGSQPDPSCAILVGGQSDCRQHCRTVADCARWRGDGFCRDSPPQDYARHRCQRGPAGPGGAARYYTRRAPPLAGGHLIRLSDIHGHQLALTSPRRSNRNSGVDAASAPYPHSLIEIVPRPIGASGRRPRLRFERVASAEVEECWKTRPII